MVEAIPPLSGAHGPTPPASEAPVAAPPSGDASGATFAATLRRQLERPRAEIARVRADIDSIRSGGFLERSGAAPEEAPGAEWLASAVTLPGAETAASTQGYRPSRAVPGAALPAPTGPREDPYGWRAMARQMGEQIIGPGYGDLFERQIQQESGFDPDVVYGLRVSSAGAEGIAQLMPQYYPGVDRTDPREGLLAGARTMHHYLTAWDGDVRRALASYNAGLGRVRSLVAAHGDGWEQGLPLETRQYLHAILGPAAPQVTLVAPDEVAVFGGRGPGGVLTLPLDRPLDERRNGDVVDLTAPAGSPVRAPSDGTIVDVRDLGTSLAVVIDHGNGWRTAMSGLAGVEIEVGEPVRRSEQIGTLAGSADAASTLRVAVSLDGRVLDAARYLLHS